MSSTAPVYLFLISCFKAFSLLPAPRLVYVHVSASCHGAGNYWLMQYAR